MEENVKLAKQRLLSTPLEELSKTFFEEMFAAYYDTKERKYKEANCNTTDVITLTKAEYAYLKRDSIKTTLGELAFNRFVLEKCHYLDHNDYWSIPLDKSGLKKLDAAMNLLVLMDKLPTKEIGTYIDNRDQFGFWFNAFNSTALSAALLRPMPSVLAKKKELFEKNKERIANGDAIEQIKVTNEIEGELMKDVRNILKDDPGYDLYASGDGNLDNNYKIINVMKGAVFNNITQKFDIAENSMMEGTTEKDIPLMSNTIVAGAYPSAISTAEAGYMSKIILAVLQSVHLDPDPKSDCGTHQTIPFTITKFNKGHVLFRNILDGGKIVNLTPDTVDSYIGKRVRMFSPQCCLNKSICAKCGGRSFLNLGVRNAGLMVTEMTDVLLNLKLKSKHDLSQKADIMKIDTLYLKDTGSIYIKSETNNGIPNHSVSNKYTMRMFIPKVLEAISGFYNEGDYIMSMGIFPIKFYDNNDKEIESNMLTIPALTRFNVFSPIQEDAEHYIITYEPNSDICNALINATYKNCEAYIDQIYLHSTTPQIPYDIMTDMMFRSFELNRTNLNTPALGYEFLARRLCFGKDGKLFAFTFGKGNADPMGYVKLGFREAVQKSGALQGILFQDISQSLNYGLAETIRGATPEDTPLEKIIRA